jgi:hypothetical protein
VRAWAIVLAAHTEARAACVGRKKEETGHEEKRDRDSSANEEKYDPNSKWTKESILLLEIGKD